MKGFQYCLILGIFIAAAILGIFFCVQFFGTEPVLFLISVAWTAFFAFAVWAWLDKKRTSKFEAVAEPVIFGLFFVFLIVLMALGLWFFIQRIAAGTDVAENILALIVAEGVLLMFAVIIYKHYIRKYVGSHIEKVRKRKNRSESSDR
jgi:hypothetical protein